jgi:ribosome biogenesis protein ERB1
LNSDKNKDSK